MAGWRSQYCVRAREAAGIESDHSRFLSGQFCFERPSSSSPTQPHLYAVRMHSEGKTPPRRHLTIREVWNRDFLHLPGQVAYLVSEDTLGPAKVAPGHDKIFAIRNHKARNHERCPVSPMLANRLFGRRSSRAGRPAVRSGPGRDTTGPKEARYSSCAGGGIGCGRRLGAGQ